MDADERLTMLSHLREELDRINLNLWPDAAAGGATVSDLVGVVKHIVEFLDEKEI